MHVPSCVPGFGGLRRVSRSRRALLEPLRRTLDLILEMLEEALFQSSFWWTCGARCHYLS